ncbi:MAG: ATP-binding protein, partial [Clostridiaceae bacterium]
MKKYIKLDKKSLTVDFENLPNFSTTEEVSPYKDIIGQKRAEQSIDLGLQMSKKEYNIFISGRSNTGKTSYIVKKIRDYAKELPSPKDWCYVYNFQNDKQPIAISLETGTANNFKDDMDKFIEEFLKKVPIFFNDQGYEREKNNIIRKYEKFSSEISNKLSSMAEERSFSVEQDAKGNFLFIPLKNGIKLQQEEYTHMSQEDKNLLEETLNELRLIAIEVDKELLKLNKQMGDELDELDTRIAESIIEDILDTLYSKYDSSKKIMDYLTSVKKDIIENLDQFFDDEDNNGTEKDLLKKVFLKRYKVNVIVSNCTGKGAPVIFEDSTEYSNIFGKIEYENIMGSVVTNFTMISPGSIDLANGGYLIINADKLLNNLDTWKA